VARRRTGRTRDPRHALPRLIIQPLDLRQTGYDPTAVVHGKHATPYIVENNGKLVDATNREMGGLEGSGGIVSDARDEAHFLTELMQGKIVSPMLVSDLQTPSNVAGYGFGTGVSTICGDTVFTFNGRSWNSWGDYEPQGALQSLYCTS
jgi:CubicO group peptidase (beta-lactamase class C family)